MRSLVREPERLGPARRSTTATFIGQPTDDASLEGVIDGIDAVISWPGHATTASHRIRETLSYSGDAQTPNVPTSPNCARPACCVHFPDALPPIDRDIAATADNR